ncbi:hypothetical protein [Amycolatopsis sp. NPDC004378]
MRDDDSAWGRKYFPAAFVAFLVLSFAGVHLIHQQPLRQLWPICAGVLVALVGLVWRQVRARWKPGS